jgi:general secretion pathway protein N
MRVETADAALGEALAKAGFAEAGGVRVLKVEGAL